MKKSFNKDTRMAIYASQVERTVMSDRTATNLGPRDAHRRRDRVLTVLLWLGLVAVLVLMSPK